MDVVDTGLGLVDGDVGGLVAKIIGALFGTVHADAADEGALAAGEAEGGEEVGGGDVDGSEVGGAGGAICEGAGDDLVVDAVGVGGRNGGEFGAAEGGFDGEGVV